MQPRPHAPLTREMLAQLTQSGQWLQRVAQALLRLIDRFGAWLRRTVYTREV